MGQWSKKQIVGNTALGGNSLPNVPQSQVTKRPIQYHCLNINNLFEESTDFEKEVVLEQGLCYKSTSLEVLEQEEGRG